MYQRGNLRQVVVWVQCKAAHAFAQVRPRQEALWHEGDFSGKLAGPLLEDEPTVIQAELRVDALQEYSLVVNLVDPRGVPPIRARLELELAHSWVPRQCLPEERGAAAVEAADVQQRVVPQLRPDPVNIHAELCLRFAEGLREGLVRQQAPEGEAHEQRDERHEDGHPQPGFTAVVFGGPVARCLDLSLDVVLRRWLGGPVLITGRRAGGSSPSAHRGWWPSGRLPVAGH
mmetsp:Transcript_100945/g.253040  ORF Transcript_100945/g.253040 Transcript_100945/m.253040 type:complete len:230 (+) Transcript_100945:618-1307(+)